MSDRLRRKIDGTKKRLEASLAALKDADQHARNLAQQVMALKVRLETLLEEQSEQAPPASDVPGEAPPVPQEAPA